MTTIATDGRTIAADGMTSYGNERGRTDERKIRAVGGSVYALAGVGAVFDALVEWVENGAKADERPGKDANDDGGWSLLVFEHGRKPRMYTSSLGHPNDIPLPFAMGSGQQYALAAMKMGGTPRRAVEIAAECDVYTGGIITEIDIHAAFLRLHPEDVAA